MELSGLDGTPQAAGALRIGVRLVTDRPREFSGRRRGAQGGRVPRERIVLRDAGRHAAHRPDVFRRRRSARGAERPGRGDQLRLLAARVQRRSARPRPDRHSRERPVHGDWRDGPGLLRPRRRPRVRRHRAARRRAAGQPQRGPADDGRRELAERHRAAETRADARVGHRATARRQACRSSTPRSRQDWTRNAVDQYRERPFTLVSAATRRLPRCAAATSGR